MQQPIRMPQRPTGSLTDVDPRRPPRPTEGLDPRRRPRPTHRWDPERGVVSLDPNSPAQFIPPPPPAVLEAFMQGTARRQRTAIDVSDVPMGKPIPNSGLMSLIDPRTGLPMLIGATPTGTDNEMRRFWPTPENVPVPIPTTGWQNQGPDVLPRGYGRY